MSTVVVVHGVWNYRGPINPSAAAESMSVQWRAAIEAGAFGPLPSTVGVVGAYYAHRLRRVGSQSGTGDFDRLPSTAEEMLGQWLDTVSPQSMKAQGRVTRGLRQELRRMSAARGINRVLLERVIGAFFEEVSAYLDPDTPRRILARTEVANAVAQANRVGKTVVVAHSLGSVVAYEALHAYPHLHVDHLVTLGSPLALPHAIFHRLDPLPGPLGVRPRAARRWSNISDVGDLIAQPPGGVKNGFEGVDHDVEVSIHPFDFHLASNYLKTSAFADALRETL
ncbi:hypothetical protein AB0J80_21580 [Actinoplanes sp. NPDC049548]|uniref:alpha/beta fold hydrolase n=1 Tax=Actinoplanes sp. NPDC049548 TaxID=3155152 RepID=UPI00343202B4